MRSSAHRTVENVQSITRSARRERELVAVIDPEQPGALAALHEHVDLIDTAIIPGLQLGDGGALDDRLDRVLVDLVRQWGADCSALVQNLDHEQGSWQPERVRQLVRDRDARATWIRELVDLGVDARLEGFYLDFAGIGDDWAALAPLVGDLSRALQAVQLQVHVIIPPGIETDAMRALGEQSDGLVIAAFDEYDRGSEPGPIASRSFVEAALQSAAAHVAPDRLTAGLTLSGYDWPEAGLATRTSYEELALFLDSEEAHGRRDARGNLQVAYVRDHRRHEAWVADAPALAAQLRIADAADIDTIALWGLGGEDPTIWPLLRQMLDADDDSPPRPSVDLVPTRGDVGFASAFGPRRHEGRRAPVGLLGTGAARDTHTDDTTSGSWRGRCGQLAGVLQPLLALALLLAGLRTVRMLSTALWLACRKRRAPRPTATMLPTTTVLLRALREQRAVQLAIDAALASDVPVDVLVLDDGLANERATALRRRYRRDPRVCIQQRRNAGHAAALRAGFAMCASQVVVYIDGDTVMATDAVRALLAPFQHEQVAVVSGRVRVEGGRDLLSRACELEVASAQSLHLRAGATGASDPFVPHTLTAWRRAAVLDAGNFTPDTLRADADLATTLRRRGNRVAHAPDAHAHWLLPTTGDSWLTRRLREDFGRLQVLWRHRSAVGERSSGALGRRLWPLTALEALVVPLLSLAALLSVCASAAAGTSRPLVISVCTLVALDGMRLLACLLADARERDRGWRWLPLLFGGLLVYRGLTLLAALRSLLRLIDGAPPAAEVRYFLASSL